LLPFDKPWHGLCSANFRVVLFVELHSYNTVVLEVVTEFVLCRQVT